MSHGRRAFCAIGLLVAMVACTSGETRSAAPRRVVTSGRCPGEAEAIANPKLRKDGRLDVDVDGDGTPDEVFLVEADGGPRCSTYLMADTDAATLSTPVPQQEALTPGIGLPALTGAAQIDKRPGLDVYVTVLSGASTTFLNVFSAGSGRLELLEIENGQYGSLFPSGASVAHAEASDCGSGGNIVVSKAERVEPGWGVRIQYLRFNGRRFVPADPSEAMTTDPIGRLMKSFPEFRATPFGSCPSSTP